MTSKKIIILAAFIAVSELAGMIGSVFTAPSIPNWFAWLEKPLLSPPSWVFAPVWTILFLLMGIAAFLVYAQDRKRLSELERRRFHKRKETALTIFGGQLMLNILWSIIFFGLHNPGAAFVEIIILWLAILIMIIAFYRISRPAAFLLLPYILWVSFASYLNAALWILNKP